MGKTKVVVLGGGVGAMTAALRLTATPELRARYDVTVHQLGWRLGGKGASGRNPDQGWRIEEHGLHVWFGFYDNALRLMIDTYAELGAGSPPEPGVFASFEDAFHPCRTIALYDRTASGDWQGAALTWPDRGTPGSGAPLPTFWEVVVMALDLFALQWSALVARHPELGKVLPGPGPVPPWMHLLGSWFGHSVESLLASLLQFAKLQATGQGALPLKVVAEEALAEVLLGVRDVLWEVVALPQRDHVEVRMAFQAFDIMAATVHGLVHDGVLDHPDGLHKLDGYELSDWLLAHHLTKHSHGATPPERAPALRALYDVAFGYLDGDVTKPDIAAGTAINDLLRLGFTYHGSLAFKMQGGMGDTVFTPMHKLLVRRGVTFEFFSAVTALHVDPVHGRIGSIDVVRQVATIGDAPYDPYVTVHGLDCWPSEPDWAQLVDGAAHRAAGVDFELDLDPLGGTPRTLHAGKDFDEVVLGISIGALCSKPGTPGHVDVSELAQHAPRFAAALDHAEVVRTQAFQLWLADDTSADLGYPFGEHSVAGCFVEPLDTYCDMTHLLAHEDWTDRKVTSIAYFCGVLDHRAETHAAATARVRANMQAFCEDDLTGLWPAAGTAKGSGPLAWDRLACGPGLTDSHRLDDQYWRANTHGTELYVLTPQGTVEHRLPSGDTGFANLVAAGDWTRNGIDGGCVEAAAVSGIDAANAIVERHRQPGEPAPDPPVNVHVTWLGGP